MFFFIYPIRKLGVGRCYFTKIIHKSPLKQLSQFKQNMAGMVFEFLEMAKISEFK
jgi:hypothetical protein